MTPNLHGGRAGARASPRRATKPSPGPPTSSAAGPRPDAMLITRGPDGMTLSVAGGVHHVPAQTRDVADVTGAGDTVVAVLAACLGSGWAAAGSLPDRQRRRRDRRQPPGDLRRPGRRAGGRLERARRRRSWTGTPPGGGSPRPAAEAARSSSPTAASTSSTPATSPAWKAPSGWATCWSSASTPTPRSRAQGGRPPGHRPGATAPASWPASPASTLWSSSTRRPPKR